MHLFTIVARATLTCTCSPSCAHAGSLKAGSSATPAGRIAVKSSAAAAAPIIKPRVSAPPGAGKLKASPPGPASIPNRPGWVGSNAGMMTVEEAAAAAASGSAGSDKVWCMYARSDRVERKKVVPVVSTPSKDESEKRKQWLAEKDALKQVGIHRALKPHCKNTTYDTCRVVH